jgi:hypothetical protein
MKKLLTIFLFSVTLVSVAFGQKKYDNWKTLPTVKPLPPVPCVTFFDQPNYQGNSVNVCVAGSVTPAFAVRSVRVASGFSVYFSNIGECVGGQLLNSDMSQLSTCGDNKITILAIPGTRTVSITLLKVESTIHNNDCKKFYGNVGFYLTFDDAPIDGYNRNLLSWARGPVRNVNNWTGKFENIENSTTTVRIDASLFTRCKLNFQAELGSAHKQCDLCSDFTWESKMATSNLFTTSISDALYFYAEHPIQGPMLTSDKRHKIHVMYEVKLR